MEDIEGKLAEINSELQQLDKDIGFQSDRRGFKRYFNDKRPDEGKSMSQYGYVGGGAPKRRREDERRGENGDRKRITYGDAKRDDRSRDSHRDGGDYDEDEYEKRPKRTLQSTVVMPAIETKSRDEKLMELAKTEKKEVVSRNKRMFAGLMSALTGGAARKDDVKKEERAKKMKEKLNEVEQKLEEQKQQEKEKAEEERKSKILKRKELEIEQRTLTRKKALIQYAEAKKTHYKQLSNFIMTTAKPSIFFLPAKHSMRSLELLKTSQKTIDGLIALREKELQRELEAPINHHHDEQDDDQIKSFVAKPADKNDKKSDKNEKEEKQEEIKEKKPEIKEEAAEDEDDEGYEPDIPDNAVYITLQE